jgi:hypothetical protein
LAAFHTPKGGDREPGADEQSDWRSIEGSRRHRARISDYYQWSLGEDFGLATLNATSESVLYMLPPLAAESKSDQPMWLLQRR